MDKSGKDNRAQQLNPNSDKYQGGTGYYTGPQDKHVLDNKSQQQNPNNERFDKAREGNKK